MDVTALVEGAKLFALGGTVETARRVGSNAWTGFINSFYLTAHFSDNDYPYDWLLLWLSKQPEWQRSKEFEATTRVHSLQRKRPASNVATETLSDFGSDDDEERDELDDLMKPKTKVVFQPTYDTTHSIFYKGHWLRIKRTRRTDTDEWGDELYEQVISVSVVARSNDILKELVKEAKNAYEADTVERIQIYLPDVYGNWRWTDSKHKRPISSIVLPKGTKERIFEDAKDFLASDKWYADRGIPFRRGYLLHGPPGTGKSSLMHAIAGEVGLDIYVISLSACFRAGTGKGMSDEMLGNLMGSVPERCVLLLEDLDAAFNQTLTRPKAKKKKAAGPETKDGEAPTPTTTASKRRKRKAKEEGEPVNTLSLSGLLNALDGVAASEGRILVVTTNHPEKLDPALKRPGRMDVWVEFNLAIREQMSEMFRGFFPVSHDEEPTEQPLGKKDETIKSSEKDQEEEVKFDVTVEKIPEHKDDSSSQVPAPSTSPSSSLWSTFLSYTSQPPPPQSKSRPKRKQRKPRVQLSASSQHIRGAAYQPPLPPQQLYALSEQFAESIPEGRFSMAEIQGYLLKWKGRPDEAMANVGEWVDEELKRRGEEEVLKKSKEGEADKEEEESETEEVEGEVEVDGEGSESSSE